MNFEITERWLMDSGGWQAMKPARAAWKAGAVLAVEFDGTRLRGQVNRGGKPIAAGLLIKSRTDVTNLCSCPETRRTGALCEHSLALGLAWMHREKHDAPTAARAASPTPPAASASGVAPAAPGIAGPLEITLPPTFFAGLARQRLGLSLRVVTKAGEEETEADRRLHAWLAAQRLTRVPPQLALADARQINALLLALRGHPRVSLGGQPFTIPAVPPRLPLRATPAAEGGTNAPPAHPSPPLILRIDLGSLPGLRWWVCEGTAWGFDERHAALHGFNVLRELIPLFSDASLRDGLITDLAWLVRHGETLAEFFDIDESSPDWPSFRTVAGRPQFRLFLDGSLQQLTAELFCRYGDGPEFPLPMSRKSREEFPLPSPAHPGLFLARHEPAEAAALAQLERAGFTLAGDGRRLTLRGQNDILCFYAGSLPEMEEAWTVEFAPRLRTTLRQVERITPTFHPVSCDADWLSFGMTLAGNQGTKVSWAEARRWLTTGQSQRRLPNGRLAVLVPEQFADLEEVLRDLQPEQRKGAFRIRKAQLGYLEASLQQKKTRDETGLNRAFFAPPPEIPLSAPWRKILRKYQRDGAAWMLQTAAAGWGGILADEMGLGKTVQALAVMATLRDEARAGRPLLAPPGAADDPWPTLAAAGLGPAAPAPCLVVAPTSLLGNWRAEAARFAPDLRVLVIRSGERARELDDLARGRADLVITSYALLARDLPHYTAVEFHAVFLDEAGFVRNPDTQASKAVRRLRARTRFALTGTPIENSVGDLWAIMEFALPGYLGRREDFRERYELPLQAGGQAAVLDRLRRRMAPYWLRRLKQEVARELPSKIEKIVACELTPTQRDIYTALQREGTRKVDDARRRQTSAQARLTMLTALLRLRQTCGDPRLLGEEEFRGQTPEELSGKWSVLGELLEEIRDGGHNVLIFSQFATQLRLLQEAVRAVGLDYCHLDGTSRDREAQITAFQTDPAKRVFLISLKAGGYGLNLTKADTVIHFDPWWNPAVENQATDRAHRIGQTRPVTVYKLIAAGTVEEKIIALQQQKKNLLAAALDDTAPLLEQGLSEEELRALMRDD